MAIPARRLIPALCTLASFAAGATEPPVATPPAAMPQVSRPDAARWTSPPFAPGVQGAWLTGAPDQAGLYTFRVKMAAGARIPPHTHPDERQTTVLSGTLYVGFGAQFDESALVPVPAGAVYVAPAKVPHFLWAKDGEVSYQEHGLGPTATTPTKN